MTTETSGAVGLPRDGGSGTAPIRVVHLQHAHNGRTIDEVVVALAGEMHTQGAEVVIVATMQTEHGAELPPGVGLVDLRGSARRAVTSVLSLRRTLRRLQPAVVYAHAHGPILVAVLATWMLRGRPRLIGIEHNHYSSYPWTLRRLRHLASRLLLPRVDLVLGVSGGVVEDLAETFPAVRGRLEVVPPPLTRFEHVQDLAAAPVDHAWFGTGIPVVVTVGHVHPRKDHRTLIRAMAHLRAVAGADAARLVIIGGDDGEEAREVRHLIRELGLEDQVELLGAQANPLRFVARAEVFALSSRNEGMPLVLLEAMSLGIPIVSTDCPSGPAWILEDGAYGRLVPVGDGEALGDALLELLADDGQRRRYGRWGIVRAAEFSPAAIAERYLAFAVPHRGA